MKFKVVIAHGVELPSQADSVPRIGEEILMTVVGERGRMTVYNVVWDLDAKTVKVFVR